MAVDWILVADRGRARVLHAIPDATVFPTLVTFVHPEADMKRSDLESDASGRTRQPGEARTALEPHTDHKHLTAERFAHELTEHLEKARQEGRFERLFVVAPPLFLGELRKSWKHPLAAMVAGEVDKDFSGLSDHELMEHLRSVVSGAGK
jgi:protein required for attachment to host cells